MNNLTFEAGKKVGAKMGWSELECLRNFTQPYALRKL